MKVLLVSLSNIGGGASRIVSSLHSELLKKGVNVELAIFSGSPGEKIRILNNSDKLVFIFRLKNFVVKTFFWFFKNKSFDYRSINIFPSKLCNFINESDADIVHLHWIGAEMISIKQISKIKKIIIWTLHDAWPLNGSYHINPNDYFPEIKPPTSYFADESSILERNTLRRKKKYFSNSNICFTSPSNWLKEKFDVSFFNQEKSSCVVIPNFIDLSIWTPIEKTNARKKLNLDTSKTLLIFGSSNGTTSYNKGFHFIKELIKTLPPEKFGFLIFGNEIEVPGLDARFETYYVGKISDINIMKNVYSAGDITIVPSMSESFSLVSLESIACNTPVLAFDTSGIRDIVKHKQNGFLADRFNVKSLRIGINWLIENRLIDIVDSVKCFSSQSIVPLYQNLYLEQLFVSKKNQ